MKYFSTTFSTVISQLRLILYTPLTVRTALRPIGSISHLRCCIPSPSVAPFFYHEQFTSSLPLHKLIPLLSFASFLWLFDSHHSIALCASSDNDSDNDMESQPAESFDSVTQLRSSQSQDGSSTQFSQSQEGSPDQLNSQEHEFIPVRRQRSRARGFNATLEQSRQQPLATSLQRASLQSVPTSPYASLPMDTAHLSPHTTTSPLLPLVPANTTVPQPPYASILKLPPTSSLPKKRSPRRPTHMCTVSTPTRVIVNIGCFNTLILLSPAGDALILMTTPKDLFASLYETSPHFDGYHFLHIAPFDLDSELPPLKNNGDVYNCPQLDKYYETRVDSRSHNLLSLSFRVITSRKNILDIRSMMEPWTRRHHIRLTMSPAIIPPTNNWPSASELKTNYIPTGWLLFSTPDLNRIELQHILTMELYKEDPSTRWLNDPISVILEPVCNMPVDGSSGEVTPTVWIKCMNHALLPLVEHLLHRLFSPPNHLDRPLSRFLTYIPLRYQRTQHIDSTTWNYYFQLQKALWSRDYQRHIATSTLPLDPYAVYDFRDHPQQASIEKMSVRRYIMSRTNLGNYPLALGVDRLPAYPWRTDLCAITFHPSSTGFDQQQILTGTILHLNHFQSLYPLYDPRHDGNEHLTVLEPPPVLIPLQENASDDTRYYMDMTSQIHTSVTNLLLPTYDSYAAENPAKRPRSINES